MSGMRWTQEQYEQHMLKQALTVPDRRTDREAVMADMPPAAPGISLCLPWPPSTNSIWRSLRSGPMAGRVLLSKGGREYRAAVNTAVASQNGAGARFDGRVGVDIALHPPTRRKLDIDNRVKACLDALTHAGMWSDDEQIDVLVVRREELKPGGAAIVRIWEEA